MADLLAEGRAPPPAAATPPLKSLLEVWPALLALVYFAGYLVVNSHFARFEFTKAELLSGRYLSAGILFLALGLAPIRVSFFALRLVLLYPGEGVQWGKAAVLLVGAPAFYGLLIAKVTLLETPWIPNIGGFIFCW